MDATIYTPLQLRELFHIEFLRWFGRKVKADRYAVKGGTNMRLFFKSFRYSEDMDIDVRGIAVHNLKDAVMGIVASPSFSASLKPFGIAGIVYPDMGKAKQTETTQRFKLHLITPAGEDLFTKVEFSRRGFKGNIVVQPASDQVMRAYRLAPLLVAHYDLETAIMQKVIALAGRSAIQARDVFDIYILSSQYRPDMRKKPDISRVLAAKAHENIFEIGFEQFRDTVVSYLSAEDKSAHDSPDIWDDIKLKAARFVEELGGGNA